MIDRSGIAEKRGGQTHRSSAALIVQATPQVVGVRRFPEPCDLLLKRGRIDPMVFPRDFLEAGDLQALPLLQRLNEISRLQQRVGCSRVEPGRAAPEALNVEESFGEIQAVKVGDLQLTARRGAERTRPFHHGVVVEIKPRYGVTG